MDVDEQLVGFGLGFRKLCGPDADGVVGLDAACPASGLGVVVLFVSGEIAVERELD